MGSGAAQATDPDGGHGGRRHADRLSQRSQPDTGVCRPRHDHRRQRPRRVGGGRWQRHPERRRRHGP
ncbi:hypothetical protein XthCFBP4691_20795, partial [Xanthomonas theicola]